MAKTMNSVFSQTTQMKISNDRGYLSATEPFLMNSDFDVPCSGISNNPISNAYENILSPATKSNSVSNCLRKAMCTWAEASEAIEFCPSGKKVEARTSSEWSQHWLCETWLHSCNICTKSPGRECTLS